MVKLMFSALPLIVPVSSAVPCGVSIEPVTFSPSCLRVAVAVMAPSGPLIDQIPRAGDARLGVSTGRQHHTTREHQRK